MTRKHESIKEKQKRQKFLLELIRSTNLGTQTDLVREMSKHKFDCTQTTISRDLLELQIVKIKGYYRLSTFSQTTSVERALFEHVLSVETAGDNLVILKTQIGTANSVAIEIDKSDYKGVIGSLAGDDTIFIAVQNKKDRDAFLAKISHFVKQER